MIRRAERTVERMLRTFPAVVLLGARQVGKTTLARKVAGKRPSVLFDLENQADRSLLLSDPVRQLWRARRQADRPGRGAKDSGDLRGDPGGRRQPQSQRAGPVSPAWLGLRRPAQAVKGKPVRTRRDSRTLRPRLAWRSSRTGIWRAFGIGAAFQEAIWPRTMQPA